MSSIFTLQILGLKRRRSLLKRLKLIVSPGKMAHVLTSLKPYSGSEDLLFNRSVYVEDGFG